MAADAARRDVRGARRASTIMRSARSRPAIALRDRLTSVFGDALSLRVGAEAGEVLISG